MEAIVGLLSVFITWGLLYLAIKYGVLHALRQREEERAEGRRDSA